MFKNIFKKTYKVSFNEFQVVISEVLKSRTDYGLNMYRQEKLLDEKDENIFSLTYCLYHIFIIICPDQILAAVTFLFIIHRPHATGVNIVKIIIVNCLTINLIFNFTNK